MITAEELLQLAECASEIVDIPDLGKVRVRSLSAGEALEFGRVENTRDRNVLALVHGLVDPALTPEQAGELVDHGSFTAVDQLTQAVLRVSKMLEGAQKSDGEAVPAGGG